MCRLAWGALTGGFLLTAGCTTGGPYQDSVDADVDAAWKLPHLDAATPTADAIVHADPDGGDNLSTTLDAGGETGTSGDAADAGAAPDATQPPVDASPPVCTMTSCGAREVCTGGVCVLARRVFVSSATFQGNLGGYAGADLLCQHIALAGGLGGAWMAWVSDNVSSPSQRFDAAGYEYALLDGTVVASSWNDLSSGTLAHAIDQDEHGQPLAGNTEVWTATNPDGTLYADGCNSFTSSWKGAPVVEVGVSGNADATWTSVYQQYCNRSDHLYCVEQ